MRFPSLFIVAALAMTAAGCPDPKPNDPDMTASDKVPSVPLDFEVEDSIDAGADKVDFKILNARKDGKAKVVVAFPEGHKVAGSVGVLTKAGESVEAALVTDAETEYALEFDVEEGAVYYLKVTSTKAKSKYTVNYTIAEPKPADPCEGVECDDGLECKEGKCVEPPEAVCDPKCKGGLICVGGECVKPCGGPCPKGQLCSRTKNECVRDPCYQKTCGTGEKCVGGVCKAQAQPQPTTKECKPACAAGQTCNTKTGTCEGTATVETPPDSCAGPLSGSIVQLLPQGAKTVLVINRGSKVCVKVGQTGKIAGVNGAFKITEVYEFRSKAVIDVDDKTIGANRSVTINR